MPDGIQFATLVTTDPSIVWSNLLLLQKKPKLTSELLNNDQIMDSVGGSKGTPVTTTPARTSSSFPSTCPGTSTFAPATRMAAMASQRCPLPQAWPLTGLSWAFCWPGASRGPSGSGPADVTIPGWKSTGLKSQRVIYGHYKGDFWPDWCCANLAQLNLDSRLGFLGWLCFSCLPESAHHWKYRHWLIVAQLWSLELIFGPGFIKMILWIMRTSKLPNYYPPSIHCLAIQDYDRRAIFPSVNAIQLTKYQCIFRNSTGVWGSIPWTMTKLSRHLV